MDVWTCNMGSLNKIITLTVVCFFTFVAGGKECLKSTSIGRREGNVYRCDDPYYPVCCEMNQEFTCCEERLSKTLREQFQLWGTVALFLLLLYVVYLYFTGGPCCSCPSLDSCRGCCDWCTLRHNQHEINSNKYMRENTETQQIIPTSVKTMGHNNPVYSSSPYDFPEKNPYDKFRMV